jgi:hypothetical protein
VSSLDPSFALQKALKAALEVNAGIQALAGNPARIYDYVPQNPVYPLITFGSTTGNDIGTKSRDLCEVIQEIEAWDTGDINAGSSGYRGQARVKDLLAAVALVLQHGTLTVTGHTVIEMHLQSFNYNRLPDPLTFHGVHAYRFIIEPDA